MIDTVHIFDWIEQDNSSKGETMQEHSELKRYNISTEHWVSRTKTCGNSGNPKQGELKRTRLFS